MIAIKIVKRLEIPEHKFDNFCFKHRIGRNAARTMIKSKCRGAVEKAIKELGL